MRKLEPHNLISRVREMGMFHSGTCLSWFSCVVEVESARRIAVEGSKAGQRGLAPPVKGTIMNDLSLVGIDGTVGIRARAAARVRRFEEDLERRLCLLDARMRMLAAEPEEGAVTAEYAVVLVAATGFAALLVAVLKSDAVRTMLSNIVKKALNVG